jgi:hypothetical protein
MRFIAITVGAAVPTTHDLNAVVHSAFEKAVNLQPGKYKRLLTVVTAEGDDLPQGIRIQAGSGFSLAAALHQGETMFLRNGILGNEDATLEIDLRNARRWKCQLPLLDDFSPQVADAWRYTWHALENRQSQTQSEIHIRDLFSEDAVDRTRMAGKITHVIQQLVAATRILDPSASEFAAGLIGLGPGLTPSGDDFLVGYLTGLQMVAGKDEALKAFLTRLGKSIIHSSRLTNDISRTYLFHAAQGQVSGRLLALAEAIASAAEPSVLLGAAENLMKIGESSGMDTLTGLLIGLSTWGKGMEPI